MKRTFVEVSTGHIPIPERQTISDLIKTQTWTCAYEGPCGWFIWTGEWASPKCPPVLKSIMQDLCNREIDYVLFDVDADYHEQWEVFE